ncbi:MAG TPA: outer membrane beta-barrel protein, partial [Anseongella sp.]|nr:outer membrane beta-barrel protein [Anseongella sp.]
IDSRLNFSAGASRQQGLTLLNGAENKTRQHEISGGLRYNYHHGEMLDLSLSGNISRQQNRFDTGQDQRFINQRYEAAANLSFLRNYALELSFGYLRYSSDPGGFSQEIPLLDLSLSRYVFKNRSGEISLAVDNLLDKDLGVSQQAGANYIERSVTESLGRYALLSFTYSLNKQLNPLNNRRKAPMIRLKQ